MNWLRFLRAYPAYRWRYRLPMLLAFWGRCLTFRFGEWASGRVERATKAGRRVRR